ncbi:MAG: hypothetical protein U0930_17350 [Pirellulales bacterium]
MKELSLFTIGWILLGVLGTLLTLYSRPEFALIAVASIGIISSLRGFNGCEMLLAMFIASIVGGHLLLFTVWAWIAPFVPGGFMLSVAIENTFENNP